MTKQKDLMSSYINALFVVLSYAGQYELFINSPI